MSLRKITYAMNTALFHFYVRYPVCVSLKVLLGKELAGVRKSIQNFVRMARRDYKVLRKKCL
jgi:hypothetical protein